MPAKRNEPESGPTEPPADMKGPHSDAEDAGLDASRVDLLKPGVKRALAYAQIQEEAEPTRRGMGRSGAPGSSDQGGASAGAAENDGASRRRDEEAKVERGLAQAKALLLLRSFDDALTGLTALRAECPGFPMIDRWLERARAEKAAAERTAQTELQAGRVRSHLSGGRSELAMGSVGVLAGRTHEAEASDLAIARELKEREAGVTRAPQAPLPEAESALPKPERRRLYFAAALQHWSGEILGPALAIVSISLTVIAGFCAGSSRAATVLSIWLAWVSGLAAAFLLFAAQFDLWQAEHDKYEREAERKARPRIHGELRNFRPRIRGEVRTGGLRRFVIPLDFEISVYNQSPVSIHLHELRMNGGAMPCPTTFSNICVGPTPPGGLAVQLPDERPDIPGGRYLTLFGFALMNVPEQAPGEQLELAPVSADLIDGFGHAHPLDVEPGASISVM